MPFVIDNPGVCGWFLSNQATDDSEDIAQRLLDDNAVAPGLWPLELAHVLRTVRKHGAMVAQQAQDTSAEIASLPTAIDAEPPSAAALLTLALRFDLSSDNAASLELTLRRQLPIATQNAALTQAAMAAERRQGD